MTTASTGGRFGLRPPGGASAQIGNRLAALLAVVLVASGCNAARNAAPAGGSPETRSFGDPSLLDDDATPPPAGQPPASVSAGSAPRATARPGAASTLRPAQTAPPPRPRDDGATGSNAKLYLQSRVPKLVIEMGAVAGKEPTAGAMNFVKSSLEKVLDKPGGIEVRLSDTFSSERDEYTIRQVEALEQEHRQTHSSDEVASLYLLFLNGRFKDAPALGVAYRAASIVIFTDGLAQNAALSGSLTRERIERSVILHEVGHALALVNLGYRSPRDHADPEHPSHSKSRESVMYYAVESIDVATVFRGGPPDRFDADDLADLADLKNNKL